MVEIREAGRTRRSPAVEASALIARDFPGLFLQFAESVDDLECPDIRAAAIPVEMLPENLPAGIDYFVFPEDQPTSGVAILFREGGDLFLTLRRFYLPPVILAGAGPGGEGMLTVDAARAIARADVILADCLCGEEVLKNRKPGSRVIPVGKRCNAPTTKQ